MPTLSFTRRARVRRDDFTLARHFASACGRYEVVDVRWLIAGGYGHYWLAIGRPSSPRPFVTKHKTRKAAERRCQEVARV